MRFGGHTGDPHSSKLEYSQFLATAFAHVISQGQDQVGLVVLIDKLEELIPPGSTPDHVTSV